MQCVHNHSEKEIMFYGCETNPMNQPIEEKWKEEFEKRFRYFFHQPCERCSIAIEGETMRDRIIFTDSMKQEVVSFIENLLEQERAERDNFWAKNEESRLKNYEALGYHKGKMAERKRMSEVLTVNLDMSQMLDGWDKYWIDAKNGRYIEGCAECGNSKRIKESIINK